MSPIKSLILAPLATVASEVWRGSKPAIGPGHSEECPPASLIKRRPARIREAAKILAAVMRLSEPGCYTRVRNPGQGEYTIFHSNESTLLKWSAQTSGGIMEEIPENMTADELSNFFNERPPGIPCPICRHQDWRILGKDGFVRSVRLIDDKGTETILSALKDLRAGKEVTLRDIEKHLDGTLFQNIAVMRCGNCGWVALFDKTFIENEIHNAKNK